MSIAAPTRPSDLLDRDREWDRLADTVSSSEPNLLFVLGRRRVGKSFLLTRFVRAVGGLYFQATNQTEREQLQSLSRVLGEHFDDPALRRVTLPDWDALFTYVAERTSGEPFVLVLDEYPYLVDAAPALPSILQRWWDHALPGTRITVVLSGSHVSAMRKYVQADQPLYGRRTGRLDVRPFDHQDVGRFVPHWSARDKLRLYATFGGLPGHLALIDPARTLAENGARHLLDAAGRLHDEAVHAFDAFLSDAAVHYSIIEAIARGERRWSRIANRVGKQTSALQRPLDWLLDMEVIEREAPITEYPRPNPKRTLYRITDPHLTFWHRFIADVKGRGLSSLVDPLELWTDHVSPRLDNEHTADVFEMSCREFVARGSHPGLPFSPVRVGRWWSSDSMEEVDVVALSAKGDLLVGECKWGSVNAHDLDKLKRRAGVLTRELGARGPVTLALFSATGLEDATLQAQLDEGTVLYFPIEALFE